jgi:hypothetical protein
MLRLFIIEHLSKVSTFVSKVIGLLEYYEAVDMWSRKTNSPRRKKSGRRRARESNDANSAADLTENQAGKALRR